MKNTKKKGFTIVELVIVIAVIGILSAILIPTFSGLVQRAKDTAEQANMRNAVVAYMADADAATILSQEDYVVKAEDGTEYWAYDAETSTYKTTTAAEGKEYVAVSETVYNGYVVYVEQDVTTPEVTD